MLKLGSHVSMSKGLLWATIAAPYLDKSANQYIEEIAYLRSEYNA
jgi:hypothetical protein